MSTLLNAEFVTTNMTVPAKMISVMPSTLPSCPAAGSVEYLQKLTYRQLNLAMKGR